MMEQSINDNRRQERSTDAELLAAFKCIGDAVKSLRDSGYPRHGIASIFVHEIKSMLDGFKYDDEGGFLADLDILWTVVHCLDIPIQQRTRQVERIRAARAARAEQES